jgi:thymidylate synthase (FAD)
MSAELKVELLQHTPDPERVVAWAARLCYSGADLKTLGRSLTPEKISRFIAKLAGMGHLSAFEHAGFTFGIEGVSRALTHQLVRHRLASYSQQSQRYVGTNALPEGAVIPPQVSEKGFQKKFVQLLRDIRLLYDEMQQAGVPAEDARYILPNACETKIIVTMNARELLHFFNLRCCNRAQWEIHALADAMLAAVKKVAPAIFQTAGPGCVQGPCPEGKMTCGKAAQVRPRYAALGARSEKIKHRRGK